MCVSFFVRRISLFTTQDNRCQLQNIAQALFLFLYVPVSDLQRSNDGEKIKRQTRSEVVVWMLLDRKRNAMMRWQLSRS